MNDTVLNSEKFTALALIYPKFCSEIKESMPESLNDAFENIMDFYLNNPWMPEPEEFTYYWQRNYIHIVYQLSNSILLTLDFNDSTNFWFTSPVEWKYHDQNPPKHFPGTTSGNLDSDPVPNNLKKMWGF